MWLGFGGGCGHWQRNGEGEMAEVLPWIAEKVGLEMAACGFGFVVKKRGRARAVGEYGLQLDSKVVEVAGKGWSAMDNFGIKVNKQTTTQKIKY